MKRHEVLRDHYEMVRSTLAAKGTKDAAGLIVMVLASMVRVYMPHLPRAADPKLPDLIRKEIGRVEMSADELALTPASAQRLIKRTLIVAGMDKDDAKEATTILRKKQSKGVTTC
jgi:hypothetical protein